MGQVSLIKRHAVYSARQSGPKGGEVWLQRKLKFSDLVVPASCRPQDQGTPAGSLSNRWIPGAGGQVKVRSGDQRPEEILCFSASATY